MSPSEVARMNASLEALRARKPAAPKPAAPSGRAPSFEEVYDKAPVNVVVDRLLEEVRGTAHGKTISPESKSRAAALVGVLERRGAGSKPLTNPLIYGHYVVEYVAPSDRDPGGQPAGGQFRSGLFGSLFKTTGLFQNVLQPDVVVNKVYLKILGILPILVSLAGRLTPVAGDGATAKVEFEGPKLTVLGATLPIGARSDVTLKTTYLDSRIRLGKGSYGSVFVFSRGGAADADAWADVAAKPSPLAGAAAMAGAGLLMAVGLRLLWAAGARSAILSAARPFGLALALLLTLTALFRSFRPAA